MSYDEYVRLITKLEMVYGVVHCAVYDVTGDHLGETETAGRGAATAVLEDELGRLGYVRAAKPTGETPMSEVRIVTCDRCGEVVAADLVRLTLGSGREIGETIDLHVECFAAFRAWLAAGKQAKEGGEG